MTVRQVAEKISANNKKLNSKQVYRTLVLLSDLSVSDFKYINAVHRLTLVKRSRIKNKKSCPRLLSV
jgi:Fe2+ or Zn2+ uptake regulation protein